MSEDAPRWPAVALILIFLISYGTSVIADGVGSPDVSIHIDWLDQDDNGEAEHAYVIEFSEAPIPSDWKVEVSHYDSNDTLLGNWTFRWGDANYSLEPINSTHYRVVAPTNISFDDSIELEVWMESGSLPSATRTVEVTLWNQPLADHEITLTTDWSMRHQLENETSEEYLLEFTGQGYQQRNEGILIHDELGSGTLSINEVSPTGSNIIIALNLNRIWLNETMEGEELTSQIFEMAGTGNMTITDDSEGNMTILASIADAYVLRSMIAGSIEEQLRLEANGNLNITNVDSEEEMYIDADISLLLVEIHDIDGVRVLDHSQFEATGDLEIQSSGSYINVDLEQLINLVRYENGEMVLQHSKTYGDGTFFFSDTNDENGSIVINGDVIRLHQESQNGTKTADTIHIDADITGATTGEFGVWRRIVDSGQTANSTGTLWDVNRIHQEDWLNLTGGGILEGMGPSQTYNETWDHEVIYDNYTNRTVYYTWYEQSNDPSQGEEWPERSPIPVEAENLSIEESSLGDVNISRESGLAPAELLIGDNLGLYSGDLMALELTADGYQTYTRDGHTMDVTSWSGTYMSEQSTASGLIINEGILAGLIAEVSRQVYIDVNSTEDVWFWENQSLERVLSPNIVTSNENTPPSIVDVRLHEGRVVNEGGNLVHIEVEVDDPDWNLREVSVDLTTLGLGILMLNDLGQDGDIIVHDDNFTASFIYLGTDSGNISIDIIAEDAWVTETESHLIEVAHRAPRLVDFTLSTENIVRGESVNVSAKPFDSLTVQSVAIDLRGEGGELFNLTLDGGVYWTGTVIIPQTVSPGDLYLPVRVEDTGGGWATITQLNIPSANAGVGGDAWDASTSSIPALHITNNGPEISDFKIYKDGESVEEIIVPDNGEGASTYLLTVNATDHDIITVVQGRLGMLAPVGQDNSWLTMRDDGQSGDAVAGDGVYSIEIAVREGLPTNTVELEFRGIDVYLKSTAPDFEVEVTLSEGDIDPLTNPTDALSDWGSTVMIVLVLLGIVMLGAGVAIVMLIRKGGSLDEQLGLDNDMRLQ
jgi:hypothetical protein